MKRPTVEELAARSQSGDRTATAEVLRRGEGLCRYIARRHPRVEFEDALQVARLGFIVGLARWRPDGGAAVWPYLSMWAHGLIAGEARKTTKFQNQLAPEGVDLERVSDDGASAAETERRAEGLQARRIVDGLSPRERSVALGRFAYDFRLDDVAQAVGVSRERVRQIEPDVLKRLRARASKTR